MANIEVKLRRGTTSQHAGFTGAVGEVTVDTDKDTVVVHDGSTAGGHELRRKDDTIAGSEIDNNTITATQIANNTITATQISDTDTTFNIDSSGRVGIGRVATAGRLEIDGDLLVVDTTDNNPVAKFSGTAGATIQLEDSSTTGTNNQKFNLSSVDGAFALGSINDNDTERAVLLHLYPKATSGGVAQLPSISTADLNAAQTGFTAGAGMIAYVTDGDSGSACLAVHDGSSFKRVALGATISAT